MPFVPAPSRRAFVQAGASTALGLGLADLVAATPTVSRSKAVILVNLTGGMSHLDTLDMKPDAPVEIRGEFKSIATNASGVRICEHLPLLAKRMHHFALVRSLAHRENGHLPGTHRLLTGATMPLQRGSDLDNVLSRRDWPSYAAGLNYLRPRSDGVPNGVTLPHALIEGSLTWPGQHAGFLGQHHDPMLVTQDPNSPKFKMDTFTLPEGVDPPRVARRRSLLDQLESPGAADPAFRDQQARAFEMLNSGKVASAFQLDREPVIVRDRYGRNQFGQSLLLARRLVQSGVPIVQANMGIVQSWDTHADNWGRLKNRLLPWLDRAVSALVDDLHDEGRLGETFVAVVGEFGRTPKISNLPGQPLPGRDHWAHCYSGLFAGAGVVGGRAVGKSDKTGAYPVSSSYAPFDIGATIYRALGVSPDSEIRDPQGRPTSISAGKPMDVLFHNR